MPKKSSYQLAWSPTQQAYVLSQGPGTSPLRMELETPGWFAWLEHVPSFAFAGQSGSATLRKERLHGEVYWYAYRRAGERLTKKYVGKTTTLTIARLEQMAGLLETMQDLSESPLLDVTGRLSSEEAREPQVIVHLEKSQARPPSDALQPDPLLFSKLHVARPRAQLVPRPHLLERLGQASALPLTLVSAPAGFGKTTLLAQWLAQRRMPVAWLSLEPQDNDPLRFLSYLIAALQTVQADVSTSASALLHSPQPPPLQTLFAMLTNDLTAHLAGEVALVLDDYHVITAAPLHQALLFLVEHGPPQLHLVLASRADPPLPLARLRARGQLGELRAAQLQFAQDETRLFLQGVMGLDLSSEEVATLQSRTEGWIAGLQLAALSLQGRPDVQQFLADFTGSQRHLVDYLVEEVLVRQPETVQSFLLQTSILDRLSAPLCDAVTESSGSQAMLEALERANLFLFPLDAQRQWYRYHQLFAQVLRVRLRRQCASEEVAGLYARASAWYTQNGFAVEAVEMALAAPDFERAAQLIEPICGVLLARLEYYTLQRWFECLPRQLLFTRAALCLAYAHTLYLTGPLPAYEVPLQQAERLFGAQGHRPGLGSVSMLRAMAAVLRKGDALQSIAYGQQALALLPEEDIFSRSLTTSVLARAYWLTGEVNASWQTLTQADLLCEQASNVWGTLSDTILRADLLVLQGQLRQAAQTYASVLASAGEQQRYVSQALFGLGNLYREWNDLEAAEAHLQRVMALARDIQDEVMLIRVCLSLARVLQARGDAERTEAAFASAVALAQQSQIGPLLAQAQAYQTRWWLSEGKMEAVTRWGEAQVRTFEDVPTYAQEPIALTLARVLLAQNAARKAEHLLTRWTEHARVQGRIDSQIELWALTALAAHAQGKSKQALQALQQALALAEPEGYVRLFVDEGAPMAVLLRLLLARRQAKSGTDYIRQLLAVLEAASPRTVASAPSSQTAPAPVLLDLLSPREHKVLRLLAAGLSNPEIADELVVSLNTVKTQVSSIYRKLNVTNRKEAIAAARFENLL